MNVSQKIEEVLFPAAKIHFECSLYQMEPAYQSSKSYDKLLDVLISSKLILATIIIISCI